MVLPAPFGPSRPNTSPAPTSKSRPSTARGRRRSDFASPRREIAGAAGRSPLRSPARRRRRRARRARRAAGVGERAPRRARRVASTTSRSIVGLDLVERAGAHEQRPAAPRRRCRSRSAGAEPAEQLAVGGVGAARSRSRAAASACPRGGRRRPACRSPRSRRTRRARRRGAGTPRPAAARSPRAAPRARRSRPASAAPRCSGRSTVYLPDLYVAMRRASPTSVLRGRGADEVERLADAQLDAQLVEDVERGGGRARAGAGRRRRARSRRRGSPCRRRTGGARRASRRRRARG